MILIKSKIYETRIFHEDLRDRKYKRAYRLCNHSNFALENALQENYEKLIYFIIKKTKIDWQYGMIHATQGGNKKLIDFFISNGAGLWDVCMINACQWEYVNLVQFFISKGANYWKAGNYSNNQRLRKYFRKKVMEKMIFF